MPDPSLLTPTALALLDSLPPQLRDSPDYQAVMYAAAQELDRFATFVAEVRAQFNPQTATVALNAWEALLQITIADPSLTLAQREDRVVAMLQQLPPDPSGSTWEKRITALVGTGWSYEEHIPGDGTSPPAYTIRILLPFPPTSDLYKLLERVIRRVTEPHLDIQLTYTGGFLLDESQLDQEGLG